MLLLICVPLIHFLYFHSKKMCFCSNLQISFTDNSKCVKTNTGQVMVIVNDLINYMKVFKPGIELNYKH